MLQFCNLLITVVLQPILSVFVYTAITVRGKLIHRFNYRFNCKEILSVDKCNNPLIVTAYGGRNWRSWRKCWMSERGSLLN